jgi:hypothetical protein
MLLLLDQQTKPLDPSLPEKRETMGDIRCVVEAVWRDEQFRERG